jgi:hypothetical protein
MITKTNIHVKRLEAVRGQVARGKGKRNRGMDKRAKGIGTIP